MVLSDLAEEIGCTAATLRNWLTVYAIPHERVAKVIKLDYRAIAKLRAIAKNPPRRGRPRIAKPAKPTH